MLSKYIHLHKLQENQQQNISKLYLAVLLEILWFCSSEVSLGVGGWGGRCLYYLKFLRQGNGQDGRVGRPQAHHLSRAHRIYNYKIYRGTIDGKDQNLAENKLLQQKI